MFYNHVNINYNNEEYSFLLGLNHAMHMDASVSFRLHTLT